MIPDKKFTSSPIPSVDDMNMCSTFLKNKTNIPDIGFNK